MIYLLVYIRLMMLCNRGNALKIMEVYGVGWSPRSDVS